MRVRRLYLRLFLLPRDCCCLFFGGGRVWLAVPSVNLGVAGREDEHVGHEDKDAGGEHRHDDRQDDVQLSVLLGIVIWREQGLSPKLFYFIILFYKYKERWAVCVCAVHARLASVYM